MTPEQEYALVQATRANEVMKTAGVPCIALAEDDGRVRLVPRQGTNGPYLRPFFAPGVYSLPAAWAVGVAERVAELHRGGSASSGRWARP